MIYEKFEKELSMVKYFLECYFNPSFDFKDLKNLVIEFKETENIRYVEQLKKEIDLIIKLNDEELLNKFILKYAMRKLDRNKLAYLISIISSNI